MNQKWSTITLFHLICHIYIINFLITDTMAVDVAIEEVFPNSFKDRTGIYVTPAVIHTVDGYVMKPFPDSQSGRNHWNSRSGTPIKYLIMHYTVSDFRETFLIFIDNVTTNPVSAHYVISERDDRYGVSGGQVVQAVADSERAWHAGVSNWQTDVSLNSASIGIEHVNNGFVTENKTLKWFAFDSQQMNVSGKLSKDIVRQYNIQATHVLAHSDIAPTRKEDPGILFPWARYYREYGVGAWLDEDELNSEDIVVQRYKPVDKLPKDLDNYFFFKMLKKYGYSLPDGVNLDSVKTSQEWSAYITKAEPLIKAFKAHFSANQRPELYDSPISKADMYWIWALVAKYIK